ncbi:TetR/AcrR family transcriptional regulator [Cupriavidus pauculus]|uniref:TetR family transcriptional regulator n=1 Tax=Cupriavidus pauculus TaxID=82633 RepID=A0A2N5CFR3_9BURK|nr:TetR/AcrR family transcriptional regulator [Cupriavidus pauculus]PLQ01044.1 TetR family transcriptional regulator [Cupriavidus pauculus]
MARTKAPDFEAQREQILDLAAAAFAASSYPSTSMADLAAACGTSKARLYHYYESKEAILFDLLDRYTRQLLQIVTDVEAEGARQARGHRETFGHLLRAFLAEYETSQTRHIALINDVKFLAEEQRDQILQRERDVVAAFARLLQRAYPDRVTHDNQTALTMTVFGMINWTFTWLKPGGRLSYAAFAEMVVGLLENGLAPGMQGADRADRAGQA